jgi:hypothetical protein
MQPQAQSIKVEMAVAEHLPLELKPVAAAVVVTLAAVVDVVRSQAAQFKTVAAAVDLVSSIHLALPCSKLSMAAMQLQDKDQLVEPRAAST